MLRYMDTLFYCYDVSHLLKQNINIGLDITGNRFEKVS